jgi:hypothetical protein
MIQINSREKKKNRLYHTGVTELNTEGDAVTVLKTVSGSSTVCFAAGEEEVGGADGLCRRSQKNANRGSG